MLLIYVLFSVIACWFMFLVTSLKDFANYCAYIVIPIVTLCCFRCVMSLSYSTSIRQLPKNISYSQEKDNGIYKLVLKSLNFKYQTWSRSKSLNWSLDFNIPFVSKLLYLFLAKRSKAIETTLMSIYFSFILSLSYYLCQQG